LLLLLLLWKRIIGVCEMEKTTTDHILETQEPLCV
jgi:hypothetical protein